MAKPTQSSSVSQYSVENAIRFDWSSVTAKLHPGRKSLLERSLVGTQILDAGCGGGAYVDWLARQGFDATGVDAHAEFLTLAAQQGRKGRFVQAPIETLPFQNKSFDTTFCFDVLEHVDDYKAIRELARVTRKRLIVAVPKVNEFLIPFSLTFNTYTDPTHLRYYTEESLRALAHSIPHRSLTIAGEIPISFRRLAQQTLDFQQKRRLTRGLLRRLFQKLLSLTSEKKIYVGLTAVMDLE